MKGKEGADRLLMLALLEAALGLMWEVRAARYQIHYGLSQLGLAVSAGAETMAGELGRVEVEATPAFEKLGGRT